MDPSTLAWEDIVTVGLAGVGAVLGVMNTWNALSQRRLRLVVRPMFAHPNNGGPPMISIAVTNLSNFAVTVTEVGFVGKGGAKRGRRAMVVHPQIIDGKAWPRRLQPREAVSTYFDVTEVALDPTLLRKAYAGTECGEYVYGTSPSLDQLRDIAGEQSGQVAG